MAGLLEAAHNKKYHQIAYMQAWRSGVEAKVERDRT
jgi:hypothetical protein